MLVSTISVLANDTDADSDTLTVSSSSPASNGILTLSSDGSFTYDPNQDFNGTDVFMYSASDGTDSSNTATVTILVTAVNDPQ